MRPDPAGSTSPFRKLRSGRRSLVLGAASGAAVLLAAGCSGGNGAMSPVSGTITIAAAPGIDDAPLYLAQEKGLFTAAGLHVKIEDFGTPSAELNAVERGQADIAASDYGNIFAFQLGQKAGNLKILADAYDATAGNAEILISPHSKITSPARLLTVPRIGLPNDSLIPGGSLPGSSGSNIPQSLIAAAATKVISNYLASNANTLTWKPMSQQQEVADLGNGTLQAALLTEPYIYEAESQYGASELVDAFSGQNANMSLAGYVATSTWVKGNTHAVADFQSAIAQAQAEASQVGPIQQSLAKSIPAINPQTAAMVTIGTYPTATSASALTRVSELMYNAGILSQVPDHFITDMLVPRS